SAGSVGTSASAAGGSEWTDAARAVRPTRTARGTPAAPAVLPPGSADAATAPRTAPTTPQETSASAASARAAAILPRARTIRAAPPVERGAAGPAKRRPIVAAAFVGGAIVCGSGREGLSGERPSPSVVGRRRHPGRRHAPLAGAALGRRQLFDCTRRNGWRNAARRWALRVCTSTEPLPVKLQTSPSPLKNSPLKPPKGRTPNCTPSVKPTTCPVSTV